MPGPSPHHHDRLAEAPPATGQQAAGVASQGALRTLMLGRLPTADPQALPNVLIHSLQVACSHISPSPLPPYM